MNSYSTLTQLKSASYLNISTVTDYDTPLLNLLIQSSRLIDKWCERFFYVKTETRYYDGAGRTLRPNDILSITTLKTDEDGDATFENSFATTDYFLYPLNDYPKTEIQINPNGDYGSFANGIKKGIEIIGSFGYADNLTPYISVGTLGVAITSTTATSATMTTGHSVEAGHTILIDNEQMFVSAVSTNTLTIKRGMNGTTAATHLINVTVSAYEYPMPITQACLITAMRAFKRKDSAFQDMVGSPETGQIIMSKGVDPDVVETIKEYRRLSYP